MYEKTNEISLEKDIFAVGADSTAVNTGSKQGAITLLEEKLKKSLNWIICSFYLNELPLRHLCKEFIGPANGPSNHNGIIGDEIQNCENIEIFEDFVIMQGTPLPEFELNDLSMDLAYSYRIIKVIQTGVIDYELFKLKPRKISHSSWLTTANRLCRLYVTKNNLEIELSLIHI